MSPDPAAARVVRLGQAGTTVEIECPDPATRDWLAEFFGPGFGADPGAAARRRVIFVVAPDEHARLTRRLAAQPRVELDGFTLDGSFSRPPVLRDRSGLLWMHEERCDVFVGVPRDEDAPLRVVAERPDGYARVALLRVVRELFTVACHRAGLLPLHAAAFVTGGGAVLVCGAKRAGKTSVLVHALERGARFLSNDRVWIRLGDAPHALPMPTIVMLRDGTLERFPSLCGAFERERFDRSRTIAECAPDVERPAPRAGAGFDRPGISPAQLCALLGCEASPGAPLRALVFPEIDPEESGLSLARLPQESALPRLQVGLLKPCDPTRLSEIFAGRGGREPVDARVERSRCAELLRRVPAFACRLGPDAYSGDLPAAVVAGPDWASASSRKESSA